MKTLYQVLGVDRSASATHIKASYRTLCKRYHPDRNKSSDATKIIQEINNAYDVLSDPEKRATYDYNLKTASQQSEPEPANKQQPKAKTEKPIQEVRCERCKCEDASLRLSVFSRIYCFAYWASKRSTAHVYCAPCRVRESLISNLITLTVGWWGIGIFWTIEALFVNSSGGKQPKDNNASLLALVGYNLFRKANLNEAEKALSASLRFQHNAQVEGLLNHLRTRINKSDKPNFRTDLLGFRAHPAYYNACLIGAFVCMLCLVFGSSSSSVSPYYSGTSYTTPSSESSTHYYHTAQPSVPAFNEPPEQYPSHGVYRSTYGNLTEGCPFTLRTSSADGYFYVKLEDWHTKRELASYFVFGGIQMHTLIPAGSYRLKYAAGRTWYGTRFLFGPDTQYSVAESKLDFTQDSEGYSGLTIELILQTNGNLDTKRIRPEEF